MDGVEAIVANAELDAALGFGGQVATIDNDEWERQCNEIWQYYCGYVKMRAPKYVGKESSSKRFRKWLGRFWVFAVEVSKVENADGTVNYISSALLYRNISQVHDYLKRIVGKNSSEMDDLHVQSFRMWKHLESNYGLDGAGA